jgi:hypothetical protein
MSLDLVSAGPKNGDQFTISATVTHANGTSEPIEIVATWTDITQATFTYTLPDGLKAGDTVQLGAAHLGLSPVAVSSTIRISS